VNIKFSCVVDNPPKFAKQALTWAASLLTYGEQGADSLVIHNVGEWDPAYRKIFDAWGVATATVERFDPRHGPSNKLTQLDSDLLHLADYVVLCDCDIAFCGSIMPWISGSAIRACIAALKGLSAERWAYLFWSAGLELPAFRMTMLENAETLPSYCNGGLLIIPQGVFQELREAWPKWNRWALDRANILKPYFVDQISFAMACEELRLSIDHLPPELNFHTRPLYAHRLRAGTGKTDLEPLVLHYHQRTGEDGLLKKTYMESVDRQIEKINDVIRWMRRTNFMKAPESFYQTSPRRTRDTRSSVRRPPLQ
jgi:hypothetical protein